MFKGLFRGWIGEKKTAFNLFVWLDIYMYKRYHNVIIPSKKGTAQIDHLLISPFGIFIVETKNKKGWIFGSEGQEEWTQTLYRNKYKFQNPLKQTYWQKRVLAEFLQIPHGYIETVVYFVGDSHFKTALPPNVLNTGLSRYIRSFRTQVFSEDDIIKLTQKIEHHLLTSNLTNRDHMRSLRARHNSTTKCPRCGNKLVERTARKGPNVGNRFLGCSSFPRCNYSKNI